MAHHTHHPSDETLLRSVDGEHPSRRLTMLDRHLADCAPCRERRQELQAKAEEFLRACRDELGVQAPLPPGLRERVHAKVTSLSKELDRSWRSRFVRGLAAVPRPALVAAALVVIVPAAGVLRHRFESFTADSRPADALVVIEPGVLPVRSLTPGATRPVRLDEVCDGRQSTDRPIPMAVRQAVLRDYRMEEVPVHEYELDYLITPELGGSEDRLNLWPERYGARVWNARVKDELEQLLPQLVCRGRVDLATAQRDIAVNWIAAYKKYFHTDRPLGTPNGVSQYEGDVPTLVALIARAQSTAFGSPP